MSWSTPITVAANDILTAAQYNQSIRDNLMGMSPALASGSGNWFTVSGLNQIAERDIASEVIDDIEQTSSTTYVDLGTPGPFVTVSCNFAIVLFSVRMRNLSATNGKGAYASIAVSGATEISANDSWMISTAGIKSNNPERVTGMTAMTLNSGDNTFTMKYKCQANYTPAQFEQREIVVIGL